MLLTSALVAHGGTPWGVVLGWWATLHPSMGPGGGAWWPLRCILKLASQTSRCLTTPFTMEIPIVDAIEVSIENECIMWSLVQSTLCHLQQWSKRSPYMSKWIQGRVQGAVVDQTSNMGSFSMETSIASTIGVSIVNGVARHLLCWTFQPEDVPHRPPGTSSWTHKRVQGGSSPQSYSSRCCSMGCQRTCVEHFTMEFLMKK